MFKKTFFTEHPQANAFVCTNQYYFLKNTNTVFGDDLLLIYLTLKALLLQPNQKKIP